MNCFLSIIFRSELSKLWIVSMNCHNYELCRWIVMSMNCHNYELSQLWIMFMNCYVYEILCQWITDSIDCHVYDLSCPLSMICCVYELSCRWNVSTPIFTFIKKLTSESSVSLLSNLIFFSAFSSITILPSSLILNSFFLAALRFFCTASVAAWEVGRVVDIAADALEDNRSRISSPSWK